ncbi:MAG: hypothetical protein INR73_09985 [Williamsia sp.]|nr:hypothetical protein [Williamsia sp.]
MKKNLPLLSGSLFLLAIVGILEFIALRKTNGTFCYPLDDTFIHMAVAKNVALYGNWGISPNEWVSTSSSPFYTALLALSFKLFGINSHLPFILGVLGALLAIVAMQQELNKKTRLTTNHKALVTIITVFIGAMPALAALGMEHTFQVAFTLLFVHSSADVLTTGNSPWKKVLMAALWGALTVITRYENAFIVAVICSLLFVRKRFLPALVIGFISALPVILFGLYAVSKGGLFIPNSIQIKVRANYVTLLNGGLAILELAASLSGLVVLSGVLIVRKQVQERFDRSAWILLIFLLSSLIHAVFGGFGWFYRYEAYLIVLGSFHLLILFYQWLEGGARRYHAHFALLLGAALACTVNLPLRSLNSCRNFSRSTYNIYEQQYQVALFLSRFYNHRTVAANDIGAISYLGQVNIIDLWGLGSNEVTKARKGNYWNADFLQKFVLENKADIAVVYESWFPSKLIANWKKVGTWEVSYSHMLGDTKVSFYAIDQNKADELKNNLEQFSTQLPSDVKVEYTK